MPALHTQHFGDMEYQEEAVLRFPSGLPGFDNERVFVLIQERLHQPLVFMQSVTRANLCFPALPILSVEPAYRLNVSAEDLQTLELPVERQPVIGCEVLCLALVCLGGERAATANLLSPILVNLKTRKAVQAIQTGSPYSHQHPLFPQPEEALCS